MTETPNNALQLPAIIQAFATTRVMTGLRPPQSGSANPRNRRGAMRTSAQSIGLLMQAMAQNSETKS